MFATGLAGVALVAFAWQLWRDPRTFRTGVFLLVAITSGVVAVLATTAVRLPAQAQLLFYVTILGLILLSMVGAGIALFINGLTMVRKEARTLGNLLSLLGGLAILGWTAITIAALLTDELRYFYPVLFVSIPLGYFTFGFMAMLVYAPIYQRLAMRLSANATAVIVLGSRLIGGQVPPLLAGRIGEGIQLYAARPGRVLVMSGGQGDNEERPEAAAMAQYVRENLPDRVAPEDLLTETQSRDTQENLRNCAAVLTQRGIAAPYVVATNDYHALRAAMLMRQLKIAGQAVGSKTARYFRPSATIREYFAILREHWVLNLVALVILCLPMAHYIYLSVTGDYLG